MIHIDFTGATLAVDIWEDQSKYATFCIFEDVRSPNAFVLHSDNLTLATDGARIRQPGGRLVSEINLYRLGTYTVESGYRGGTKRGFTVNLLGPTDIQIAQTHGDITWLATDDRVYRLGLEMTDLHFNRNGLEKIHQNGKKILHVRSIWDRLLDEDA